MAKKRGRVESGMTAEDLARRMARFLATAPRSKKTREYLEQMRQAKPAPRKTFVMLPDIPCEPMKLGDIARALAKKKTRTSAVKRIRSHRYLPEQALVPAITIPVKEFAEGRRRLRPSARVRDDHRRLFHAQGGRCGICGERLPPLGEKFLANPLDAISLDHVIPQALGGKTHRNVVVAHVRCNGAKADRRPTGCELLWLSIANGSHP